MLGLFSAVPIITCRQQSQDKENEISLSFVSLPGEENLSRIVLISYWPELCDMIIPAPKNSHEK